MISPELDNLDLAYETGVHLGDGNIWNDRYVISGSKQNETRYYEEVLSPLVSELYSVEPAIAFQNNSVYLRVYCKELVLFKHNVLGLPLGRKEGLRIPSFVASSPPSSAQVVSGLYDADGSVKIRHDKSGDYPRISFGQKHKQLVADIKGFLGTLGITSTMYRNDYFDPRTRKVATRWFLDVNGFRNFDLFVDKIGTRNPYVDKRLDIVSALR